MVKKVRKTEKGKDTKSERSCPVCDMIIDDDERGTCPECDSQLE